jgi:dolichol-phosphate mannosyltransferase
MYLSIVSPVYRAEPLIKELVEEISKNANLITKDFEIILVEDAGPDNSWQVIEAICLENQKVKGIKFSRNFGQHYAITAGLAEARGEWIVVMDCDLQDVPAEIPRLYAKAKEGFDLVFAQRIERQDTFGKRLSSAIFYAIFSYLTDTKQDKTIANYGIYHKKVINAMLSMKDHIRYFPTMSQWVGFKKAYLPVVHAARKEGTSSYSLKKLLELAFNNMIAFSDKPLRIAIKLGLSISLLALLIGIFYLYKYLNNEIVVMGYASLIVSLWFLSGMIIFILGVVGIYIGKTFERVKERPIYIIDKKINCNDDIQTP